MNNRGKKLYLAVLFLILGLCGQLTAQIPFPPEGYKLGISLPPGIDPAEVSLAATGSLTISDAASVKGRILGLGKEGASIGQRTQVGDILSLGPVFLNNGAHVEGEVISGSYVKIGDKVVVRGAVTEYAEVSSESLTWTLEGFKNVYGSLYVKSGYRQTLKPGAYTELVVDSKGTLILGPGTYYTRSLTLAKDSTLVVDATRGAVNLYVGERYENYGRIYSGESGNFLLGFLGKGKISLNQDFKGTLVAPLADVILYKGKYQAAVFAYNILVYSYVILDPIAYFWEWLLDFLVEGNMSLYFSDGMNPTGRVYKYDAAADVRTTVYTRPANRLYSFSFSPWDPDLLYYVNANQYSIYMTDLTSPSENTVYTHTTYVRDIAFDSANNLFFSESTGAGADGKIYRINPDNTVSLYYTVKLSDLGFWAGTFDFAPDGTLYLSHGNLAGGSLFQVDVAADTVTNLYTFPGGGAIVGIYFATDTLLYHGTNRKEVYSLDLTTMAHTLVYTDYFHQIWDVGLREEIPAVDPGTWVLPQSIRDTYLFDIKSTGLLDYTDAGSGLPMINAPFGGTLSFVMNSSNNIPTADAFYYRFQYQRVGSDLWNDFHEGVSVHYVKNRPNQTPIFPNYSLGPVEVNGMNLYRFRPHELQLQAELGPSLNPDESVEWPKIGFSGDRYRAHLQTVADGLAPGEYLIRVEVYDENGIISIPGSDYDMLVPVELPGGVIDSDYAPLEGAGYELLLHIDNRKASAAIDLPYIGGLSTDSCGFLRYFPPAAGIVNVSWHASHPAGFAMYKFFIRKAASGTLFPITDEVTSMANGGDGLGNFYLTPPLVDLLGSCNEAAFAIDLDVYAKATTGNGYRISQYDDYDLHAFAISPW